MAWSSDDPFVDRLREAVVDPGDLDVEVLRASARAVGRRALPGHGLGMARLAFGWRRRADSERLRQAIGDEAVEMLPPHPWHLEAVLAVSCLIEAFSRTTARTSIIAALATRCAIFHGWEPAHPDLGSHANRYLGVLAASVRTEDRRHARAVSSTRLAEKDLQSDEALRDALKTALQAIDGLSAANRDLLRTAAIADEQREVAWWLLAGTGPAGPAQAAYELASITQLLPGPVAADELLATRMGQGAALGDDRRRKEQRPLPALPEPIIDFCSSLIEDGPTHPSGEVDDDVALARALYDQLLLVKAYEAAK